jgi:valyl-tRNA synthetase
MTILHPFMPFVTEEIWNYLPHQDKKMLMIEEWPVGA